MPQKSWAVGEEVLAADFNTYLQNQVCPQFPNVATRDSQWASPPQGALCVTTDTNTLWQRLASAWVNKTAGEIYSNVVTGAAGTIGGSEAFIASIVIPAIPYAHRIRVWACDNYSWTATGTIDQHLRYNTTGNAAAVGDTLLRSSRVQSSGTGGQASIWCEGQFDRAGAGGSSTVSLWAITSGISVTVAADATTAQLSVRAIPL